MFPKVDLFKTERQSSGSKERLEKSTWSNTELVDSTMPANQHKINPGPYLKELVEELSASHDQTHPMSHILERILQDKGMFGREYRGELYKSCYLTQLEALAIAKPDEIKVQQIKHLEITHNLLTFSGAKEMNISTRSDWAKLLIQRMALLSLSSTWSDEHNLCLEHTLGVLNKILAPHVSDMQIAQELQEKVVISLRRLLEEPPEILFSDVHNTGNVDVLIEAVKAIGILKADSLRESLQSTFWRIHGICCELDPDNFGIGFDEESDSESFSEQEDEEEWDESEDNFGGVSTLEVDDSFEYETIEEESMSFEDHHEVAKGEALEAWEFLHGYILNTILELPNPKFLDNFWSEILSNNEYYMIDWSVALRGLAKCEPHKVDDFLPELVHEAFDDPYALVQLMTLMSLKEEMGDYCKIDTVASVIKAVKELSRKEQKELISQLKSLIKDECELIEDMETFIVSCKTLAQALRLKFRYE